MDLGPRPALYVHLGLVLLTILCLRLDRSAAPAPIQGALVIGELGCLVAPCFPILIGRSVWKDLSVKGVIMVVLDAVVAMMHIEIAMSGYVN